MENLIKNAGFDIVHSFSKEGRQAQTMDINDLKLSHQVIKISEKYNNKIYKHQHESLKRFIEGKNICLATSTGSGKSDVFFMAGIQKIAENPNCKILAIYPQKALGRQQEERWNQAIKDAEIGASVCKIDGDVDMTERIKLFAENNVIVCTPDVIHAWFLRIFEELEDSFRMVELIIVDEIHVYTGVFGSNAGYLFRRLRLAIKLLSEIEPQFIVASGTIHNPNIHLQNVIGTSFDLIDLNLDTSPKYPIDFFMIDCNGNGINNLSKLIRDIVNQTQFQIITFVDSRNLAANIPLNLTNELKDNTIFAYRAGYEDGDARSIQNRLQDGYLRAIVSTSALEMGIDIEKLDICILYGIPNSATSYYQRIGRIGRKNSGIVILVNDKSVRSTTIFKNPESLDKLPLAESCTYLDNPFLQMTHALCLNIENPLAREATKLMQTLNFPAGFIEKYSNVIANKIPDNLAFLQLNAGESYHHKYPLRSIDTLFQVIGSDGRELGVLTISQILREAYPLAIWTYLNKTFRVTRIDLHNKFVNVIVNNINNINTQPIIGQTNIFPKLTTNIFSWKIFDKKMHIIESEVDIEEKVVGFIQNAPHYSKQYNYPHNFANIGYDKNEFSRRYKTTGVTLYHPIFNEDGVQLQLIGKLIKELFTMQNAMDPLEVDFGSDNRILSIVSQDDNKFVCIYDKMSGSLRLTNKLMDQECLCNVFDQAIELIEGNDDIQFLGTNEKFETATINAIKIFRNSLEDVNPDIKSDFNKKLDENLLNKMEVIIPYSGPYATRNWNFSSGINPRTSEIFLIYSIAFRNNIVEYRGNYKDNIRDNSLINDNMTIFIQPKEIIPFGESKLGVLDLNDLSIESIN